MGRRLKYEELRILQKAEKGPVLKKVGSDFYESARERISDLQAERDGAYERDPNSKSLRLVDDELRSTRSILESVIDSRLMKILQMALIGSRSNDKRSEMGGENMTCEEEEVYEGALAVIRNFREKASKGPASPEVENEGKKMLEGEGNVTGQRIILALEDVPPFMGPDGINYRLKEGDVVSVPEEIADLLVKKGVCDAIR